ncbi:MAG: hypothetical protein V7L13_11265 [Nostoc sp.]|uniref:hypothetical protein n=1 Tax=Nostoc sp. TaxID=1180 RepID=UPI002FF8070C
MTDTKIQGKFYPLQHEEWLRHDTAKQAQQRYFLTSPMELSRICGDGISESSNSCQNHPPPVSEFLLGGIDNSPSKNSEQIEISLSIDSPSKKRRNWGEGNGTIHWRTITRGGKDYPQAYYHWQEKGRKKTKYIPKHLLGVIQDWSLD